MDIVLLLARLLLGLGLAAHGAQKLFGWFGGHGLKGTGGFMESLGFRPGVLFALAAGSCELAGGLLTAMGLLNPLGPALIVLVKIVAMISVHVTNGFFAQEEGYELPLAYAAFAVVLAFAGPGLYSLDHSLGLALASEAATGSAIALAAALACLVLASRGLTRGEAPTTGEA